MIMIKNVNKWKVRFTANGIEIKRVEKFNYLGSFLTSDGKSDCEIKRRIMLNKEAFSKKIYFNKFQHHHVNKTENLEMLYLVYPFIWMRNMEHLVCYAKALRGN